MKKLCFLLAIVVAFISCGEPYNEPEYGGKTEPGGTTPGGGGGGGTQTSVSVSFSYEPAGPFTYKFTNTSKGATSYKWDFGDGKSATTKDATHTYEEAGTYKVTLTGTYNGQKYDSRADVKVSQPEIYISGYTLYKIPRQNAYYKVVCKDDDWFTTNWGFETAYTPLLDNSDIPYTKIFSDAPIMDELDGDNYYTFYVYWSNSTNGNGTQCLKQQLSKSAILEYKDEHILTSNNGDTQIGILFEYK